MSPLLESPREILTNIFSQLNDFKSISVLTQTCRLLSVIYRTHQNHILAQVGLNAVVCFPEALRAVRSINEYRSRIESSETPLQALSYVSAVSCLQAGSSLEETKAVLDLQHLFRCIEQTLVAYPQDGQDHLDPQTSRPGGLPTLVLQRFGHCFYNSIYITTFLALLYDRPFHQLAVSANAITDINATQKAEAVSKLTIFQSADFNWQYPEPEPADIAWLRDQHILYKLQEDMIGGDPSYITARAKAYSEIFEPFTKQLVRELLANDAVFRTKEEDRAYMEDYPLFNQMIAMVHLIEHMKRITLDEYGTAMRFSLGCERGLLRDLPSHYTAKPTSLPARNMEVILPGSFRLEKIIVPINPQHTISECLRASPATYSSAIGKAFNGVDVACVLEQLHMVANPMHPLVDGIIVTSDYDYLKYLMWKYAEFDFWKVWELVDDEFR